MSCIQMGGEIMKTCEGCKYWSELMAMVSYGKIEAVCLNNESIHNGKFVSKSCDKREEGVPVDLEYMEINQKERKC